MGQSRAVAETLMRQYPSHITAITEVAKEDLKETKPLKLLARLQMEAKKYTDAVRTCEQARKIDPNDTYWVQQLMPLYVRTRKVYVPGRLPLCQVLRPVPPVTGRTCQPRP